MSRDNQERPDSCDYELFEACSSPRFDQDSPCNVTKSDGRHFRPRKNIPADVRERQRQARCGPPGREFENSEGYLPKIPARENARYEEGQVGEARKQDPGSKAGERRIVQKVQLGKKRKVMGQYHTEHHYNSDQDKNKLSFIKRVKRK